MKNVVEYYKHFFGYFKIPETNSGLFGQSNMHDTFDFCPDQERIECNKAKMKPRAYCPNIYTVSKVVGYILWSVEPLDLNWEVQLEFYFMQQMLFLEPYTHQVIAQYVVCT